MSEPKKEFYLIISDKPHKATIKYHPNVGFVYNVRFFNEKGEVIEQTIQIPEEDYDVILGMFDEVEHAVLLSTIETKQVPLYPETKVEVGSNTVTDNSMIPVCDNKEIYDKAIKIENIILEKHPELKAQIDVSKQYREKEMKEKKRQAALDELIKQHPEMFKGRELSLEGIELIKNLMQPVYSQEEPKKGI